MELSDKVIAVSKMQHYIITHLDEDITLDDIADAVGYSKYHAARIFKELTGRTLFETIRALRLTKAAKTLQSVGDKVIDVALSCGFDSHDGFTRAFSRQFGLTPQKYHAETPPINWFVHYPIEAYHILKGGIEPMLNEKVSRTVTVTVVERPARKLIFLRHNGTDYLSGCEEVGCDWEGFFNSIPEKFDTAAGGRLPKFLIQPDTNGHAFFVEVPLDYYKPVPAGYEIAELPPCTYLYFNGMPYEDPNDFPIAIGIVNEAIKNYPFERFGWEISDDAPFLGMGAEAETGARSAVPVRKVINNNERKVLDMEKLLKLKTAFIEEFNALGIEGLHLTDLNLLKGSYINLEYTLPNGQKVRLLEDDRMYLGNQVEIEGKERCYGVAADENYMLVCEYGCNGSDPEIVVYKRR